MNRASRAFLGTSPVALSLLVTALIAVLFGAVIAHFPLEAIGIVLFAALLWLAYARPATAFIAVTVGMIFPYTWTPSVGGHFLIPSVIGGLAFVITGIVRQRWFHLNIVDWVVLAYVSTSAVSSIANSDGFSLIQASFETILLPYVGWRMLLANVRQVRAVVAPCLVGVGMIAALVGILELLHGSGLFIHALVDPRLAVWAKTYFRSGEVRIAGAFGQPIALGMFLLIPLGFAITSSGRLRPVAVAAILSAEILTLSRGPWIGAIVLVLTLLPLVIPQTRTHSLIAGLALLAACGAIFAQPAGKLLSATTQQGTAESATTSYRANLLQTSVSHASAFGRPFHSAAGLYEEEGFKDIASFYALTLGERGLVGLVPLLFLLALAIVGVARGYKQQSRLLVTSAAVVLAQLVALITAPPITNYGPFLWLTVACLATWFAVGQKDRGDELAQETSRADARSALPLWQLPAVPSR